MQGFGLRFLRTAINCVSSLFYNDDLAILSCTISGSELSVHCVNWLSATGSGRIVFLDRYYTDPGSTPFWIMDFELDKANVPQENPVNGKLGSFSKRSYPSAAENTSPSSTNLESGNLINHNKKKS